MRGPTLGWDSDDISVGTGWILFGVALCIGAYVLNYYLVSKHEKEEEMNRKMYEMRVADQLITMGFNNRASPDRENKPLSQPQPYRESKKIDKTGIYVLVCAGSLSFIIGIGYMICTLRKEDEYY